MCRSMLHVTEMDDTRHSETTTAHDLAMFQQLPEDLQTHTVLATV